MTSRPPLIRPRASTVGGVSQALASHLGFSRAAVRWGFVGATILGGAGLLFYLWLWALVPRESGTTDDTTGVHRRAPIAAFLVALGVISAGIAFATLPTTDSTATSALLSVVMFLGAAVVFNLTLDRADRTRTGSYGLWVRGLAAAMFLVSGIVALLSRPTAINAVLGVGLVVLGVAVIVAPRVVTLWIQLQSSQEARVREEQRAEIAAHLHDSVLQTLALIQNRAGASTEVARIARAQERELRDWLFTASAPVVDDLASEVRAIAAALELDYPVRIDVVTAGEFGSSHPALVAAAREAMLNAARHVGGDVSVYLESTGTAIDIFIRDRGPGLVLADVPTDRLGIRESIIGRMSRVGGTATVTAMGAAAGGASDGAPGGSVSADSGTEVHLHLEATS
ncbi:MAG: PspC domain-containing protein [Microbacteriaceae bacterium]